MSGLIWGQGDGSGLKVWTPLYGRMGALGLLVALQPACPMHWMAQHEEIHALIFRVLTSVQILVSRLK